MDDGQAQKYNNFVKTAWEKAVNHKDGETIPTDEFLLLVDKDGYRHITTTQRIRHIYKQHGNEKIEKSRGQIAIKESDIEMIPDIIGNYTFVIKNIVYENKDSAIYAKQDGGGTYIYIEQISERRRTGTVSTFFKLNTPKDADSLLKMLNSNGNYNIENREIITVVQGGGNPTNTASPMSGRTAANSVNSTADNPLSDISAKKSSSRD